MRRFVLILGTVVLFLGTADATTYYVDPDGAWGNNGTSWATAWNHPNRTNYTMTAGDTCFFAPGEYDSVLINLKQGTGSQRTVYSCSAGVAGRGLVIWHGGLSVANSWTNSSGQIYYTTSTAGTSGTRWVEVPEVYNQNVCAYQRITGTVDSLLIPMKSVDSLTSAGRMFYDRANTRLYVWCYGGGSPTTKIRTSSKPVVLANDEAQDKNTFVGIGMRGGYQGVVILGHGGSDMSAAGGGCDSNMFIACDIGIGIETQSNNPSGIYHGNSYGATKSTWAQYNEVRSCSITQIRSIDGGGGLHAGFGLELYACDRWTIDSNVITACGGGIGLKMGLYDDSGLDAESILIRYNIIDCNKITTFGESATGIWVGNKNRWTEIAGNVIYNTNIAINMLTSDDADPMEGGFRFWNNTLVNAAESFVQFSTHNVTGGNWFKYNIIVDTVSAPGYGYMVFRATSDGTNLTETPSTERYWSDTTSGIIDSNMYYTGSETFSCLFMSTSGYTGTNWSSWQSHFDAHSTSTTDPQLNATTYAPSNATAMSVTHSGRTWTRYGAIQPDMSIADTCIQITGKTTLAASDTCYCIVDSLLYTFAQRDTLINTGGHDNIRIWGYHSGGGRGIIGFSASDTGSLSWPTDSSKAAVVLFMNNSDNVTVKNLAIVPRTIPDSVRQIIGMNALTVRGLLVENCSTRTAGFASRAFQSWTTGGGSSMNLDLYDSHFGTDSKGYNRRDQLYGATIAVEAGLKTDPLYEYLVKVHQCRVQTIHTGIGLTGSTQYPLFYLDTNTVTVDARNDLYMDYDDGDVNNSAGDPYGISCDGVTAGSRMLGNTITSMGATYYGGDGLLLQHVNATAANPFDVSYNQFYLQHGPHPRIAEGRQAAVGTYIRNYSTSLFVSNLHYHHNLGYIVVDTNAATTYRGRLAEGVRMGFDKGSGGNIIENNHFSIIPADSATRTTINTFETAGLAFVQADSLYTGKDSTGRNTIARNNYWRVPKNPFWFGDTRVSDKDLAMGSNNCIIDGDTANAIYDGDSTFARFHQSGTYWDHHFGNSIRNVTLQGYANAADVIKGTITIADSSTVAYPSEDRHKQGKQLELARTINLLVTNESATPIADATVWAVNAYGGRNDFANTSGSGTTNDLLRWRFFGYDILSDGYAVEDSNAFNDFTIWAKSGNDSASVSWTLGAGRALTDTIAITTTEASTRPTTIIQGTTIRGTVIRPKE